MSNPRRLRHSGSFLGFKQHSRIVVDFEARVRCEGIDFPAKVRTLSVGGLFLEASSFPPFGRPVEVTLELPHETLVVDAIVRWMTHDGFGVQFASLGARETRALAELVREAPDGPVSSRRHGGQAR